MRRTKKLTLKQYQTPIKFNLQEKIKSIVDKEAELMIELPTPEIPKFTPYKKLKSVGILNFVKSQIYQLIP